MTVSYINLMRVQARPHDTRGSGQWAGAIGHGSSAGSEFDRQIDVAQAARARLWNRPGARPGANMPRTSKTVFHKRERPAVDPEWAMKLVCEDQQVSPTQLLSSTYSAAVAARHMFWTVLLDGGHPVSHIARMFNLDPSTVRLGIQTFRDFQRGSLA